MQKEAILIVMKTQASYRHGKTPQTSRQHTPRSRLRPPNRSQPPLTQSERKAKLRRRHSVPPMIKVSSVITTETVLIICAALPKSKSFLCEHPSNPKRVTSTRCKGCQRRRVPSSPKRLTISRSHRFRRLLRHIKRKKSTWTDKTFSSCNLLCLTSRAHPRAGALTRLTRNKTSTTPHRTVPDRSHRHGKRRRICQDWPSKCVH